MRTFFKILSCLFAFSIYLKANAQDCLQCDSTIPVNNGIIFCTPMNGNATDATLNPVSVSVNNAALVNDRFSSSNSAYDFTNVSSDKINYSHSSKLSFSSGNSLTISAWIFARTVKPSPNTFAMIRGTDEAAFQCYIGGTADIDSKKGKLVFLDYNSPTATARLYLISSGNVALNTWNHVAVTIDRSTKRNSMYLNGVLVDTDTVTNSIITNGAVSIGNHNANAWGIDGMVDDLKIYNRSLSAGEVYALSNNGKGRILTNDTTIRIGDSIQVSFEGSAGSYIWTPATGVSNPVVANPFLKPTVTTTYKLTYVNGLCSYNDSIIITVDTTSVTLGIQQVDKNSLKVYPNPSRDGIFRIGSDQSAAEVKLKLFNTTGQLIDASTYKFSNRLLNISELERGLYFIEIEAPSGGSRSLIKLAYW